MIRVNHRIRSSTVLLIGANGEKFGVVPLNFALNKAEEEGLDLVEVAPNVNPPVCRIMDFGKLKYETKKKEHGSKKKQHVFKLKEIRFRPNISSNDFDTKIRNGVKFLKEGNKLKVAVVFRGREMVKNELGQSLIGKIIESLKDVGIVEKRSDMEGNRIIIMILPK